MPRDFGQFCNFVINDVNELLFNGLLSLEEIKIFETERDDVNTWNALPEEDRQ